MSPAAIRRGIAAFRGVAHRIERVHDDRGVSYYNDSKGTNVDSTIKALESFNEPVILIAGGKGKGQDFGPLAEAARGRVRRAILIGQDRVRDRAPRWSRPGSPRRTRSPWTTRSAARASAAQAGRRGAALARVRVVRHVPTTSSTAATSSRVVEPRRAPEAVGARPRRERSRLRGGSAASRGSPRRQPSAVRGRGCGGARCPASSRRECARLPLFGCGGALVSWAWSWSTRRARSWPRIASTIRSSS